MTECDSSANCGLPFPFILSTCLLYQVDKSSEGRALVRCSEMAFQFAFMYSICINMYIHINVCT